MVLTFCLGKLLLVRSVIALAEVFAKPIASNHTLYGEERFLEPGLEKY